MPLVASFLALVQPLSWAMRAPVFNAFVTVLTGWLFAPRRTVTGMLLAAGVAGERHHAAYHRVFSAARWSLDQLGLLVFQLLLPLLGTGLIEVTIDDTLARKRGRKVFGTGMHHDPLVSSRKKAIVNWGHSWVILAIVVRLPCCPGRVFSLPVLFRLYLNHKGSARWRTTYRTRPELAVALLRTLCSAHLVRRFHAFADSTYGGESVLGHLPRNCGLTSRLPLDARLHEAPPPRTPGQKGRPRKRGTRRPSPRQMLQQRARRVTLSIYGRKDRVRVVETTAHWYGVPDRPLKIVVVQPLSGGRREQAFYSTEVEPSAEDVLTGYSRRWSIEEAIQGGKSHLGFEEPQGWSRKAALRTAPMALLLYSLIVAWFAREGHRFYQPLVRPWYPAKSTPSFADMLTTLRRETLRTWFSAQEGSTRPLQNVIEELLSAPRLTA